MPLRLLFVLLAAVALLGCAARPAACKAPTQVADLTVESLLNLDVDLDVDVTSVVVQTETKVVAAYIVVPAWSSCRSSSPSTVALAGHQERGP